MVAHSFGPLIAASTVVTIVCSTSNSDSRPLPSSALAACTSARTTARCHETETSRRKTPSFWPRSISGANCVITGRWRRCSSFAGNTRRVGPGCNNESPLTRASARSTELAKAGAVRRPERQDGHQLADDLHALLAAARVRGPCVLAGHSVGGTYALVFAERYPSQVAGIALIDSSTPDQFALPYYPSFYSTWRRVSALFPSLARAGVARLSSGISFAGLPSQARREARAFTSNPRELRADRNEFAELPTVFKQAQAISCSTLPMTSACPSAQGCDP